MKRVAIAAGILFGMLLSAPAWAAPQAGDTKAKTEKPKEQRIHGMVRLMDKDAHTITVRLRGQQIERQVIYNDSTKFTSRNKPAKLDDLKDRDRVIVLGTMNEKGQMIASQIDIRDQ